MQPTGRWHLSPLALCLIFIFFCSTASAAVLGLDFGTLHLKAALVKPGIPLDIVLTKDSKRKEVAAIAFKPNRDDKNKVITEAGSFPERAYGSDALALQGRTPGEVFPNLKQLLGLHSGPEADARTSIYKERYPAIHVEQRKELGTTVIKSSGFIDEEIPFSVEELIGMELANVKRNAELMAGGGVIEDAVITVPAFYTADEKRAIIKAAGYAGLSVNSLVTDGLAVGLDYAKSRTFPDISKGGKPEYHMVYDMGAGSTTATLMRFQSRNVKDVGRYNKTIQEVTVVGAGWDRTLGGDSLNNVILQDFVSKLLSKPVLKSRETPREEITSNGRLMARLYKESERVRQVLSANTETSSSFEEILPDIDLRTKLSRTDFEQLVSSFTGRVAGPINDALAMADMSIDQVDSVILHGGAVRTPFVQKQLEVAAGGVSKLRNNVNSDESAVFGAAFKAAELSPSFKVKEIWNSDVAAYPITLTYADKEKERKQSLFTANSPAGKGSTTKTVTFKHKEDFTFGFVQTVNGEDRPIVKAQTSNLTASVDELVKKFGCTKEDIKTQFSVRLAPTSGLPEVVGGTVSCEVDAKPSGVGDTVKDWLGLGKKKDQEPLGASVEGEGPTEQVEAEASTTAAATASTSAGSSKASANGTTSKQSEKPKKTIQSIPVSVSTSPDGDVKPSPEELKRVQDRLRAFDQSDKDRLAREEAQNVLESYTYSVRDFLENNDYEIFGTASQRDEISKLLKTTREWIESSGEASKATKEVLGDKLQSLKKLVGPIQTRRKENESRPLLVEKLRTTLDQTKKLVDNMKEQIEEAARSASSAASSVVGEATASVSSVVDEFADLEEATSTSSAAPSQTSATSPYTNIDLDPLYEAYDSVVAWLTEKETEQGKLKPHEDPVLRLKDIEAKATQMAEVMKDIVYKKLRAERSTETKTKSTKTPKPKPSKSKKTSSTTSGEAEKTKTPLADTDSATGSASDVPKTKKHDEL